MSFWNFFRKIFRVRSTTHLFISAQLLGRASTIGAFVKRGEESGHINITLKGSKNDEQITIMRIDVHNKSEWLYNGKLVFYY